MQCAIDTWRPRVDETIDHLLSAAGTADGLAEWFGASTYVYDAGAVQRGFVEPVRELFDRGGNRWRAGLLLTLLSGFGTEPDEYLEYACVPELLHKGALIVDDIEDDANLRLHEPPIHERYGTDVAVNAGNFCYFFPQLIVLSDPKDLGADACHCLLADVALEMSHLHLGQTIDVQWQDRAGDDVDLDAYRQLCACKTGCLFRLSARMAAIIADVPDRTGRQLLRGTEQLAIAVQMTDDRLDVYHSIEETEEFGKARGNDIIEGKVTPLVIHAMDVADPDDRDELARILTTDGPSEDDIESALSILEETDSLAFAEERATEHAESAREAFRGIADLDATAIAGLDSFVDFAATGEC